MNTKVYEDLAIKGSGPKKLANQFIADYFKGEQIEYPINPFGILKKLKIKFLFRDFNNAEGIYIPAKSKKDFPIIGFNKNRPIQRQRFTAAHELCHHLKDSTKQFICISNENSSIEKYADDFAAELLMPTEEFRKQVNNYVHQGMIKDEDILKIAQYFGVSYEACYRKIVYEISDYRKPSYKEIKKHIDSFRPSKQKLKLKLYDTVLYEQLFDAISDIFNVPVDKFSCEVFKSEYIYYDSRMEGIKIEREKASDIVTDLRLNKQDSKFCNETNQNIVELAGLTFMYDYVFKNANSNISVYDSKELNKLLYSTAPYPESAGQYRNSNTYVKEAKFETIDYSNIAEEMMYLGNDVDDLINNSKSSINDYIKLVIHVHHRMTIIHPFRDGNGRTCRCFSNMLLLRRKLPPIFFPHKLKDEYKKALKIADIENIYDPLYEVFYKAMLNSFTILTDNIH